MFSLRCGLDHSITNIASAHQMEKAITQEEYIYGVLVATQDEQIVNGFTDRRS
jgi:disulfide oxidoreductase YuzD